MCESDVPLQWVEAEDSVELLQAHAAQIRWLAVGLLHCAGTIHQATVVAAV
jgi:hypothetical protein